VIGLLVGLFVLTQTTIPSNQPQNDSQKEQSESGSEPDGDQVSVSEAIPSSGSQINLGFHSILLQENTLSEETEDEGYLLENVVPSAQKALRVLLQRIISPNAP